MAIWRGDSIANFSVPVNSETGDIQRTISASCGISNMKRRTPPILKNTCAIATLLASRIVPMLASPAVMQVPMLEPKISGIPPSSVSKPCCAKTITIPVNALELWINAVKMAPIKIPIMGFSRFLIISMNGWKLRRGFMESDISFIPKNRIPNPRIASPICLMESFLLNMVIANPTVIMSSA